MTKSKQVKLKNNYLIGGVDSPLRAFASVGGHLISVVRGKGAKVWNANGKEYLDYVLSYGALILGHAHPAVVKSVKAAVDKGSSFGSTGSDEIELAKIICEAMPSIQKIRFTNSGTEGVMGALKLAKAFTKRNKIIKFKECYHGWSEQPYLEAKFNDLDSVKKLISSKIAAIIVEPVAGNHGVIPPAPGFLEGLRKLCDENGALLIFDEVITGFRLGWCGAQDVFKIKPDLTCLGKIIGGGFPVGAFGGRREIMRLLAPEGSVYQAGTFSGNPVTMAAGLTTLNLIKKDQRFYAKLEKAAEKICDSFAKEGISTTRVGSMFSFNFDSDEEFKMYFWRQIKAGRFFAPSRREANFVSAKG